MCRTEGKRHKKRRPLIDLTFDANGSSVEFHEFVHKSESDACPFMCPGPAP